MNNIYKVIWSKAKNCYVVASEIARSHTKSATGSEKIGGVTRRSLLASLMALSLLCGGLGVASASLEVVDQSGTAGTVTIYTKDEVDHALTAKGAATDVAKNTADIATNKNNITKLENDKLSKDVASATYATKDALNDLTTTVNGKADEAAVATALDGKANKADTLAGYGITDAYTKGDVDDKLNAKADAANVFTKDQTYTRDQVNTKLADYAKSADVYTKTDADAKFATSGALTTAKTELDQKIDNEIANRITSDTALDQKIDKEIQDRENAIKDTNDRTGGIARNTEKTQTTIEGIVKVDNQGNVKDVKGLAAETITTSGNADLKGNVILGTNTANTVTVNGNADFNEAVNMDKGLTVTSGDTSLKGTKVDGKLAVTDDADLKNTKVDGTLTTTGKATFQEAVEMDKSLTVTGDTKLKATTVDGKLTAGDADLKNTQVGGTLNVKGDTTLDGALTANGEAKFTENVTVGKDLTVDGKLNVGEIYLENNKLDAATGEKHDSATAITADGISNLAKVTEHGNTTESQFTHNKKGTINYAKVENSTGDWKVSTSKVTADGVSNKMTDSAGNKHTYSQTATESKEQLVNGDTSNFEKKTAEGNTISIKDKDADGNLKSLTNTQTVDGEKTSVTNNESSSTIKQGVDTIRNNVKSADGKESSTEVKADGITNTSDGTITNDAQNIVNNATGDMTNTVGADLTTTVGGNELHEVTGTKTENVTGKVTENYKAGQETNVTGDQDIHVTGKQTNKIDGNQENTIGGNQTTTVTGDISNTAKNITNEATTKLTDKVGSNTRVLDGEGITDTVGGSTFKQRIDAIMGNVKTADGESEVTQKGDEINSVVGKGEATNSRVTQKKGSIEAAVTDGINTNDSYDVANASAKVLSGGTKVNKLQDNLDSSEKTITDGTYTTSKVQTALDIINTAADGTITNDAKNIVNNATGDMTNTVGGKLTTTVTGATEENYNGGLTTKVTGEEKHTVTGKQTNTVEGGQENIISGGQINKITGDQTTTITGNKKETVTENVTEDYKKDLTTTVGGNEIHDVKGTKTETVEGKVTENFKNGQETNVTGDQTTNVSGTQTTTATDINRNASSGMIDTIDNDYGTNTETKVAGKTTTDVSIKGTGEEGKYIRGANESRDYLIKGTLKNSETKTVEKTSTEITDGNGKTSATIQDKTQISGSVTNGTSSAVSNVKADSIDTAVIEGTNTSLISQKKDSITSAVGNGTTSTVIQQGDKDITIASNGGTVGIVGKDIINNATNEITNTAGTKITDKVGNNTRVIDQTSITDTVGTASRKIEDGKITDTAGDSTVTTENGKGTTFSKTGSTAYREGGPTDTNISGNTITTGKVTMDYAEVMKDLGVNGNAKVDQNLEVGGTSTLKGDVTMESNATVKKDLTVEGTTTTKTLKVTENATVGGTLDVAKKATFQDAVDIAKDLSVGGNATITGDVTAKSYKVDGKTYIDANGIHANGQKITNVADGSISEGSKDAVNGGQLYTVKNDLEGKVNKVGANAAAMANLHPMEFDPDSKWNIAAAIGNYGSETAAALGAFYRPNDDVMVNLSTAFGTGENMVGGGVSVRLGKGGNKLSREETNALKAQVADLTVRMDALLSVLNPNMSKDFPDVPENHWAYEAVSRLAGNDIVQGYPDGEFHGERTMTRYEMAEIIYNALSRGAEAEKELVEEFKPELQAMAASEKATAEKAEG